ncbi:tetratricopeptide repeat protein [bacterium]|nr:tetratricopeptide repeat protein [bacterium]
MKTYVCLIFLLCCSVFAQEGTKPQKITIAVLPFENITKNPEEDWLSSGLSEQITNGLAKINSLNVVERTQMEKVLTEQNFQMSDIADQNSSVKIGHVLSAGKLLVGSYQVINETISVTSRIVDVETGVVDEKHTFTHKESLDNIFELYDALIQDLLKSFDVKITKKQASKIELLKKSGTKNAKAYEFYTKGMAAYQLADEKNLKQARDYFKKALSKDKKYTDARKALANTYIKLNELDDAIDEYEKIKKSKDADEETFNTLGLFYVIKNKGNKAVENFEKAIQTNPGFAEPFYNLGLIYLNNNQLDNALDNFKKAEVLDPDNPDYLYQMACVYMLTKKEYDAFRVLGEALDNGFNKKEKLQKDKVWEPVRFQERFRDLIDEYFE